MSALRVCARKQTSLLLILLVFVHFQRPVSALSLAPDGGDSDKGKHSAHTHGRSENAKERASDGGFSPQKHLQDDLGHRSEFDHEAILGSRNAAEDFDHLPPDVAKERLRTLAVKMDKNGDGKIDRTELHDWILHSFKMLNKEDAEERHEESDSDSDGYVAWDEYVEENYGVGGLDDNPELDVDAMAEERKVPSQSPDLDLLLGRQMMQEDRELFRASDIDGDQRLSKKEFLAFSHPEEFRHTGEVLSKRTLEERDADGDGYISFEEFVGDEARGKSKEWLLAERVKFDSDYDIDHDGKLRADEVLLWLAPDDRESAEQEADHLIENADDDLDGALDIEEIVHHHDIFVGSEATDYGQYLHEPHKFTDEL